MQRMQQQPLRGRCPTRVTYVASIHPTSPQQEPIARPRLLPTNTIDMPRLSPSCHQIKTSGRMSHSMFWLPTWQHQRKLLCPASASFLSTTLNSSFPLKESTQAGVLQHYALLTYVSTAEALHKAAIPTHRHHTEPRTQRNQGTTPRHTLAQSQ